MYAEINQNLVKCSLFIEICIVQKHISSSIDRHGLLQIEKPYWTRLTLPSLFRSKLWIVSFHPNLEDLFQNIPI